MISRRGFLGAILAGAAAPAIVRAESLMKIVTPKTEILTFPYGFNNYPIVGNFYDYWEHFGSVTGRLSSSMPARQDIPRMDQRLGRILRQGQHQVVHVDFASGESIMDRVDALRQIKKRILFGHRYGEQGKDLADLDKLFYIVK